MKSLSPLMAFTAYWKSVYDQTNPLEHLSLYQQSALRQLISRMDVRHYPEPYYGLWDDCLQEDGVLLLINPGEVRFDDETVHRINQGVQQRFRSWNKDDYLNHDRDNLTNRHDIGLQWRVKRKAQAERIIEQSIRFLHIIEYFPYHSKRWNTLTTEERQCISTLSVTQLAMQAIIDIAQYKKARFIFGIGEPWADIFRQHGFALQKEELRKPNGKRFSHRLYWVKPTETALPIIIYVSGAGGMSLPQEQDVVSRIRALLQSV